MYDEIIRLNLTKYKNAVKQNQTESHGVTRNCFNYFSIR